MRKLILTVILSLSAYSAYAQSVMDELKAVPLTEHGVIYAVRAHKGLYSVTTPIITKGAFSFNIGYAGLTKDSDDYIIGDVSYDLYDAKKHGINIPVLDLINVRPLAWAGYGRVEIGSASAREGGNHGDYGAGLTLLSAKF